MAENILTYLFLIYPILWHSNKLWANLVSIIVSRGFALDFSLVESAVFRSYVHYKICLSRHG